MKHNKKGTIATCTLCIQVIKKVLIHKAIAISMLIFTIIIHKTSIILCVKQFQQSFFF